MKTYRVTVRCLVPAFADIYVEVPEDATPEQVAAEIAEGLGNCVETQDLEMEEDYSRAGSYQWADVEEVVEAVTSTLTDDEQRKKFSRVEDIMEELVAVHADVLPPYEVE